jgi:hypothetical protein
MPGNLTASCPSVCPTTTTIYTVTITDANNYSQNATTTVNVNPSPVVTLNMAAVDTQCVSIPAVNLLPYATPAGGIFSGPFVSNNSFHPSSAGYGSYLINYTYTGSNGCSSSASGFIWVGNCTGIQQEAADGEVLLYPNPVMDMLTLKVPFAPTEKNIRVMNMVGETVLTQVFYGNKAEIDFSGLAEGLYYLEFEFEGQKVTRKIVKTD